MIISYSSVHITHNNRAIRLSVGDEVCLIKEVEDNQHIPPGTRFRIKRLFHMSRLQVELVPEWGGAYTFPIDSVRPAPPDTNREALQLLDK